MARKNWRKDLEIEITKKGFVIWVVDDVVQADGSVIQVFACIGTRTYSIDDAVCIYENKNCNANSKILWDGEDGYECVLSVVIKL